jgi:hypothetical protein
MAWVGAVTESGRRKKQGVRDLSTAGDASTSRGPLGLGLQWVPERAPGVESTQLARTSQSDQKQLPHPPGSNVRIAVLLTTPAHRLSTLASPIIAAPGARVDPRRPAAPILIESNPADRGPKRFAVHTGGRALRRTAILAGLLPRSRHLGDRPGSSSDFVRWRGGASPRGRPSRNSIACNERRLADFTFSQAFWNCAAHSDFRSIATLGTFVAQIGLGDENNRYCESSRRLRLVMLCR